VKAIHSKRLQRRKKSLLKKLLSAARKLLKRKIFAFTITELLVVITVIAILAASIFVTYPTIQRRAIVASIQTSLRNASRQLDMFKTINGHLPTTIDCSQAASDTNTCINPSNNDKVTYSTNSNNSQGYYVTIEKSGYRYNIDNEGTILAGVAPVLDSSADNYVSYNGAGNSWTDINTNSVQNGGFFDFNGSNNFVSSKYLTNAASEYVTISVWVKQGSKNGTYEIMSQDQWGTAYWPNWNFSQIGQTMKFNLTDKYANEYQCSGGQFSDSNWHYVVGVWDGSNIHAYINGSEVANCSKAAALANAGSSHPIGKYGNNPYYFNGMTGDISVYDEALTAFEIHENFSTFSKYYRL
jgi:type II secretory pathway pseudopilin PulG